MDLKTPIKKAGGIYNRYTGKLEKLGIVTFEDFLYYFPFRYDDNSIVSEINQIQQGERVTIKGNVIEIKNQYARRFTIQKATVADTTGKIEITWFNQPYLTRVIHQGDFISLSGKTVQKANKVLLQNPDYEILDNDQKETIHTGRLVPIYPETRGVSSKWLRRQIYKLLQQHSQNIFEYLPSSILKENAFIEAKTAIEQIHFPSSTEFAQKARERLSFDELFFLQLAALKRKKEWREEKVAPVFDEKKHFQSIRDFIQHLPFELTFSQKAAVDSILSDLSKKTSMNRLLEGDVGSGKTVVAAIAMYLSFLSGYQSIFMAPTEILAQQHYKTISELLSPFGVKVGVATGSKKLMIGDRWQMDKKLSAISNPLSAPDVLIGTHAVLSDKIKMDKLGLVVIDEQQRFGVQQRAIIRKKGDNPHLLTMTATPIPRTVALTIYGDLDVSFLTDMPKGRKIIKTWLAPPEKRTGAYNWIRQQIMKTESQAFIICPFIEESETMTTVRAATKEFEILKNEIFPDLKVGLLHGKLKAKEKNEILEKFKNGDFDILVATPVVEVGIDVPNATIIMIEAAERFGLSQLHQLRGRVGRGEKQSYCLLFTESENEQTGKRLKAMETIQNGPELAETDLKLRGSGDIYGTMQHGRKLLKIARFSDQELLEKAQKTAREIFDQLSNYPLLLEKMNVLLQKNVSPD